jgi:hypothetical protein
MFIVTNGEGQAYEFDLEDPYGPVAVFETLEEARHAVRRDIPKDAPVYYYRLSPAS